jgi:murein DD-endopeptidase MepM/ murein hydrolase activator NlpD
MNKRLKSILSLLLIAVFLLTFVMQSVAQTQDDLERKIKENQERIEKLKDQQAEQSEIVAALKEQDNAYQAQLDGLNQEVDGFTSKINSKSAEIDEMQNKITELENEIERINGEIDEQNKQIDITYDMLSERLRAMYMAGQMTNLEVLLTADDFFDFLTRTELLRRVSEHDTNLVKDLEKRIRELNAMIEDLDAKKAEQVEKKKVLDDEKYQLVIARAELQEKVDEVQKVADDIEKQRKDNAKKLQNLVNMEAYYIEQNEQYAKEIDEIARRAQQGSGEASGDNFTNDQGFKVSSKGYICPLQYPGTYISAGYPRYPSGGAHSGVDYCVSGGTMGKNVRAIAGGTVILVKSKTTSYGKHIMIDHGNGVTSLYAHGSALLVSEGQHVNQGDIIMLAGETGNATGPHVHLEIRINGTRVNPSNYVDLP